DDAHALGVLGENGRGSLEHFSLAADDRLILMGTLGKALGSAGAFVAGSEALIEYLIQTARSYIYTTAMPSAIAAATLASLKIISQEPERRQRLLDNITYFRTQAMQRNLPLMDSETAIQGLLSGSNEEALTASETLWKQGFLVTAIRPPTVPKGTARLRITLSADHSHQQIDQLLAAIKPEK
ncbi:MAG TPA: aminotransferase class I/II-fold pyridoxal phosphate-dependent enzyme, partial [Gammaproteobacteria bacterium]|nr:aminotransferase class I/II-fold pyridoxal phosphate-dependent enzyme [Gammaproteobacteria bacterium]